MSIFDEDFERELEESDVPIAFGKKETLESLRATAHKMVDVFLENVRPPDEILGIEKAFSLYLRHPDDPDEQLPVPIVGAMDAVVVLGGRPVIWEVKSAAKRYSEGQFATMLQPSVYVAGARIFGWEDLPVDVLVTTKAAKPDVQVERLTKGRRDELELFDLADHILKAVGAGAYPRNRGWGCSGCGYREECDR